MVFTGPEAPPAVKEFENVKEASGEIAGYAKITKLTRRIVWFLQVRRPTTKIKDFKNVQRLQTK